MLELSWLPHVYNKTIVLASASPRRRQILTDMGLKFQVVQTLVDDAVEPSSYSSASAYVMDTAGAKADEIWNRCQADSSLPDPDIIIAADTVINFGEFDILNKPRTPQEARTMLNKLSGKSHHVLTGVVIYVKSEKSNEKRYKCRFVESTKVTFANIDQGLLDAYIASGEAFDKAGGYGIQSDGSLFIEKIEGDYYNVVGLPKQRLYQELRKIEEMYGNEEE
ncbi:acetylserotonin O-methyltransferase-like protein [Dichotomocladium elegans]|nr:acetylserotonin O-methyltransferase-like protein [Dichotomocladium elegans]